MSRPFSELEEQMGPERIAASDERVQKMKDAAAVELGKRGAEARMKKLTPEQRSAAAKKAAEARWGKKQEGA